MLGDRAELQPVRQARYPEALRHADLAVRLGADRDARTIRGRALARLGKIDELTWREPRARARRPG